MESLLATIVKGGEKINSYFGRINEVSLLTVLMVFILAMVVALPLSSPVLAADDDTWELMESGTTVLRLEGVWGNSSSDVFAVGTDGTILHYDGSSWSSMTSGTSKSLRDVWGSSGSDVFAVGVYGTILHYDGETWTAMDSGYSNTLYGIWGSSGSDVFAVGGSGTTGTILHYNGETWTAMNSGTTACLKGVWGSGSGDVFAVGIKGAFLHYNGSAWSPTTIGYGRWLEDVWGSSGSNVFIVGYDGAIIHWNGSTWNWMKQYGPHFFGIWGSSGSDVFAVGDYGTILHYDGSSWSPMTSSTSNRLEGVWGSSGSDVFAVGGGGTILHYPANVYDVSGTWTATSITGGGTYNSMTKEVAGGTISVNVVVTGDITATFSYVAKLCPDGNWHGTSAAIDGTVTINEVDHPATLWLKGDFTSFALTGGEPPTEWSCDLLCPVGDTHGWTTDGSDIAADFGWSGSCSGSVIAGGGMWAVTGGSGSGIWSGVATECLAGKTEYKGKGSGTVSLPMSPDVASLSYEVTEAGTFILTRYKSNPGDMPAKRTLSKYIQVDSSIVDPEITWSEVELRVEYTDAEVSAAGIDESSLKMYTWDGTNWTVVSNSGVNTTDNYVWAKLSSFSPYSPLGDPLPICSCDADGNLKDQFAPGETVYVKGDGLDANTDYKLWIQDEPVSDGKELNTSEDPSEGQETVSTNSDGNFNVTEIWAIPSGASVTYDEYDIVADNQASGTQGTYNATDDAIDSATVAGIMAPVPELPTIILTSIGLVTLGGYLWFRRRRMVRQA